MLNKFVVLLLCGLGVFITYSSGLGLIPRYESYLCVARRNFTFGPFSCSEDCQLSHGASGGACHDFERAGRYNCFCGNPTGHLPAREQQCIHQNIGYAELCNMDCICNHGAASGVCNYNLRACICDGYNPNNDGCPAHSYEHFKMLARLSFETKVGSLAPSWLL